MTTYRGMDGFLSFGGKLEVTAGSILVNGAKTAGQTTVSIDGTNLKGVVVAGDQFTVAGESGTPVHTVTGGPFYVAAAAAIANISFTPAIATGGIADNAVMTWVANSLAQARTWGMSASVDALESTSMGSSWRTFVSGIAQWSGQGEVYLDYGDAKQAALIDKIVNAAPSTTLNGVLFGVVPGLKQFYAGAVLSGFSISGMDVSALAVAQFNFQGSGAVLPNWT